MTLDLRTYIGNTAKSGQEINLHVVSTHVLGTGKLTTVAANELAVELTVLETPHRLSFKLNADGETCTVVYKNGDRPEETDPKAPITVVRYWLDIKSKVGPRGKNTYQMWRGGSGGKATDFQVGIIKAWTLPKQETMSADAYDGPSADTLPPTDATI